MKKICKDCNQEFEDLAMPGRTTDICIKCIRAKLGKVDTSVQLTGRRQALFDKYRFKRGQDGTHPNS